MIGFYRYILAFMVAFSHLWNEFMWWQGNYAVFCFYMISGYLMSKVIKEVYTDTQGAFFYSVNRLLRIYPLYITTLLLTVGAIYLFKDASTTPIGGAVTLAWFMKAPKDAAEWLGNISLIYPPNSNLTVTQAWSLQVELVYYFAMLLLARNEKSVIVWTLLSIIYIAYLEYSSTSFFLRYSSILGASIAFSVGSLIYYTNKKFTLTKKHLYISSTLFFLNLWFSPELWGFSRENTGMSMYLEADDYGLYYCVIFGAYLLKSIVSSETKQRRGLGQYLGDLAYGIFLTHWFVAILLIGIGVDFQNRLYFIPISFILINIVSLLLYTLIENPINTNIRSMFREKASRAKSINKETTRKTSNH